MLPPPVPGVDAATVEFDDVSVFGRGTHWQQQRWQLSPGPYLTRWTRVVLAPSVWLIHELSNRSQRILARAVTDFLGVGFHRGQEGPIRISGAVIEADEPVVFARGGTLDATVSGGLEAVHLYIFPDGYDLLWPHQPAREVLVARWLAAGITPVTSAGNHAAKLHRVLTDLAEVRNWPGAWSDVPGQYLADLAAEHMGRLLASAVPRAPAPETGRPSLRRMAAVAAEKYLLEHGERPVSISELCRHIGVSERTLHTAMLEEFGQSPAVFTRTIRLGQVHAALREPGETDTVQSVMVRFGFLHQGRFSAQYRERFGETPGQTLRKHRGRSAPSEQMADQG